MRVNILHEWDVSPQTAILLQTELASQLSQTDVLALHDIHTVAGVDVSVKDNVSTAAVVVLTYPNLQVIERVTARRPTTFPYIPGLLTFREGAVLVDAFTQLQHEPDIFLFDGMGRIHPRRIGIASHMGLWLQKPTIGIGKTHFIGEYALPSPERGNAESITHKGEIIGSVLRTKTNVKPIYVSVGHLFSLQQSLELVLNCTPKHRLPEPIRQAHQTAGQPRD